VALIAHELADSLEGAHEALTDEGVGILCPASPRKCQELRAVALKERLEPRAIPSHSEFKGVGECRRGSPTSLVGDPPHTCVFGHFGKKVSQSTQSK